MYDLSTDPFEINNIAHDQEYAGTLEAMRQILEQWILETDDQQQNPEPKECTIVIWKSMLTTLNEIPLSGLISLKTILQS